MQGRCDLLDEYPRANRLNWDDRAELRASDTTGSYRVAKVLAGGSSPHALKVREIGVADRARGLQLLRHSGKASNGSR